MVFLIQNTQNRDTSGAAARSSIHELIRVNEKARNRLLRLEELTEDEMEHHQADVHAACPGQSTLDR